MSDQHFNTKAERDAAMGKEQRLTRKDLFLLAHPEERQPSDDQVIIPENLSREERKMRRRQLRNPGFYRAYRSKEP